MALYNKVVIVDDDKIYSSLMQKKMIKMKIANQVVSFENGQKALEFIKYQNNKNIDLMIVDINMPVMGGYDFLQQIEDIKAKSYLTAILVASNTISKTDKKAFLKLNCVSNIIEKTMVIDYIKKVKDDF